MKRIIFVLSVGLTLIVSCQKTDSDFNEIIGKWQLVKGFNLMMGGNYWIDINNQRVEEYTKNRVKVLYDYLGNETARSSYNISENDITIFGTNLNGEDWENTYEYWFKQDTLVIHNDGGFEYYDEYFVRIK